MLGIELHREIIIRALLAMTAITHLLPSTNCKNIILASAVRANYASKLFRCFCPCNLMHGNSHLASCLKSGSCEYLSNELFLCRSYSRFRRRWELVLCKMLKHKGWHNGNWVPFNATLWRLMEVGLPINADGGQRGVLQTYSSSRHPSRNGRDVRVF